MENPYPISVDNTLKRNQNVDNYSMRNFRDINVQFLNLFLIAVEIHFEIYFSDIEWYNIRQRQTQVCEDTDVMLA